MLEEKWHKKNQPFQTFFLNKEIKKMGWKVFLGAGGDENLKIIWYGLSTN